MRLGIMGGTFDPIHVGHLRAAENAREALGLAHVLFMPSRIPPHRREPGAGAQHRYAMAALATAPNPGFRVSDVEISREGPSYTVDSLSELRQRHPGDDLVLVVGSDNLLEIPGWREPLRLLELCSLAVVARHGVERRETPEALAGRVEHVAGPALDISASRIRQMVRAGKSVRYLVPDAVADYIQKLELYR